MGVGQTQTCPESQAGGGALGLDLNRGYGESLRSSTLPGYTAACTAEPVRSQLHFLISMSEEEKMIYSFLGPANE